MTLIGIERSHIIVTRGDKEPEWSEDGAAEVNPQIVIFVITLSVHYGFGSFGEEYTKLNYLVSLSPTVQFSLIHLLISLQSFPQKSFLEFWETGLLY